MVQSRREPKHFLQKPPASDWRLLSDPPIPAPGEGEGGGKGGEKISAARAAPRRPSGRNLRLKARAPEQYDHREYCSGALAFNRKYPYRADSAKKVDLQSGTVRDSPGHQLS